MNKKVYEVVTSRIIEKLENGVVPWKMPFQSSQAVNWLTQKPYRGINRLLLDKGEFATFKAIKKHGGKVKKGEKSQIAVFWKWIEKINKDENGQVLLDDNGKEQKVNIPFLRYYNVFEINTQVEGLESNRDITEYDHDPLEEAESLVRCYPNSPILTIQPLGAWYRPKKDQVNVPNKKEFESIEKYYSTLFHELVHSTGHSKRLNRKGITEFDYFGSVKYSKEELVAEIGASMLCSVAGIDNETIDNSASYIDNWLSQLKNDTSLIVEASQQAQKASDYIQNVEHGYKGKTA